MTDTNHYTLDSAAMDTLTFDDGCQYTLTRASIGSPATARTVLSAVEVAPDGATTLRPLSEWWGSFDATMEANRHHQRHHQSDLTDYIVTYRWGVLDAEPVTQRVVTHDADAALQQVLSDAGLNAEWTVRRNATDDQTAASLSAISLSGVTFTAMCHQEKF